MERDKKVGLSLGIMLVGIVGALFFRNDAQLQTEAPELKDAESIDEVISQRDHAPYLVDRDSANAPVPLPASEFVPNSNPWDVPSFLRDDEVSQEPGFASTPDPIPSTPAEPKPKQPAKHVRTVAKQAVPTTRTETTEYTVRHGDTLSEIAANFLGSSTKYPEVFALNQDRLKSPNDLRPGMKIRVPAKRTAAEVIAKKSVTPPFAEETVAADADDVATDEVRPEEAFETVFEDDPPIPPDGGRRSQPRRVATRKKRGLQ